MSPTFSSETAEGRQVLRMLANKALSPSVIVATEEYAAERALVTVEAALSGLAADVHTITTTLRNHLPTKENHAQISEFCGAVRSIRTEVITWANERAIPASVNLVRLTPNKAWDLSLHQMPYPPAEAFELMQQFREGHGILPAATPKAPKCDF